MAPTSGICVWCTCTDARACEGGCGWQDEAHTVCSLCYLAGELAERVVMVFAQLGPRMRPPADLPVTNWDALTFEQQQLLVMAHRRVAEAMRESILEEFNDEAIVALAGERALRRFLHAHVPQALEGDEAPDQVAIRLLTPHVGARIVIPSGVVA
jgi:hypothetical protein